MKIFVSSLEPLEARIAPAVFTYLNPQGDTVTITTSRGTAADLQAAATFNVPGAEHNLQKLDLASHPVFNWTDLSITVDGAHVADVGAIDAHGLRLGTVVVDGDLGQLDAGDGSVAVGSLHVGSLGVRQDIQQAEGANYESLLLGSVTQLLVDGNLAGTVSIGGDLSTAHIGGSLVGTGTADFLGSLRVSGGIAAITVDHNLIGGAGSSSGAIETGGGIFSAEITGSVLGGAGGNSGQVGAAGGINGLHVGGSITGGTDPSAKPYAGSVLALGIGTAVIDGQITGGTGDHSGLVGTYLGYNSVTVSGGLKGGAGLESGALGSSGTIVHAVVTGGLTGMAGTRSGSILSGGPILSVVVTGDIVGGTGDSSGIIGSVGINYATTVHGSVKGGSGPSSGGIGSSNALGPVIIDADLVGGSAANAGEVASANGIYSILISGNVTGGSAFEAGTIGSFGRIGSIHVVGSVLGGTQRYTGALLSSAQIDQVAIDGSLSGSLGDQSGRIEANTLPAVQIGGDVRGGSVPDSGTIFAQLGLGTVHVNGSLIGSLVALNVPTAVASGSISSNGGILSVSLGGDLQGGDSTNSGSVFASAGIAQVTVNGSIFGGSGASSGSLFTRTNTSSGAKTDPSAIGTVTVHGSETGGSGMDAGSIVSAAGLGAASIVPAASTGQVSNRAHNLTGGQGPFSGSIIANGNVGSITIADDVSGGGGAESAKIGAYGSITKVAIGGSFSSQDQYDTTAETPLQLLGQIAATGSIGTITIGGDVAGGEGPYSAAINAGNLGDVTISGNFTSASGLLSGSVVSGYDLHSFTVIGDITANGFGTPLVIFAQHNIGSVTAKSIQSTGGGTTMIGAIGQLNPASDAQAVAIGSVKTAGVLNATQILAGLKMDGTLANPSAQIGLVEVAAAGTLTTAMTSTDVVAGFLPGADGLYGTSGDNHGSTNPAILSKVYNVVIHGGIGADSQGTSHAIEARQVVSVTVNNTAVKLTPGADNDVFTAIPPAGSGVSVNEQSLIG